MTIAGCERSLPLCKINDKLTIAAFVMFGDVEITVKATGSTTITAKIGDVSTTCKIDSVSQASSGSSSGSSSSNGSSSDSTMKTCYCADNYACEIYNLGSKSKQECMGSCRTGTPGWGSKPSLSSSCDKKVEEKKCTVGNCVSCVPGVPTQCATCKEGYTPVEGECVYKNNTTNTISCVANYTTQNCVYTKSTYSCIENNYVTTNEEKSCGGFLTRGQCNKGSCEGKACAGSCSVSGTGGFTCKVTITTTQKGSCKKWGDPANSYNLSSCSSSVTYDKKVTCSKSCKDNSYSEKFTGSSAESRCRSFCNGKNSCTCSCT